MTVQPTRDQRVMWRQIATDAGDDPFANTLHPDEVLALLDQLDQAEAELDSWMTRAYEAEKRAWQAEHRIARLEAQTDIRGRAVVMYRERAREAEAQIKAALDMHEPRMAYRLIDGEDFAQEPDGHVCVVCREYYPCDTIRALEGME